MVLDVHPRIRGQLEDPNVTLYVTEGIRKEDSAISKGLCCIALLGVWNWRGTNDYGGTTALADWECVALKERRVNLAFDSDVSTNPGVRAALERLGAFLKSRGAKVHFALLSAGAAGAKMGLDDYFAAGHSVKDLESRLVHELPAIDDLRRFTPGPNEIPKILDAPEPRSYLPGYLPPGDHGLTVLVGRPMEGKTRLAALIAHAWATRTKPWPMPPMGSNFCSAGS